MTKRLGTMRRSALPGTALLVFLVMPCRSGAATLHVPSEFATVQAAFAASAGGDTILVAAGTWTGEGNRDLEFPAHAIVLRSESGRDATMIDCEAATGLVSDC